MTMFKYMLRKIVHTVVSKGAAGLYMLRKILHTVVSKGAAGLYMLRKIVHTVVSKGSVSKGAAGFCRIFII